MAAISRTGDDARASLRLLAYAWLGVFGVLLLFVLGVVLFGDPRAGQPVVRLSLPPRLAQHLPLAVPPPGPPPPSLAPPPQPGGPVTPPPAIVPTNITQPVYAG